MTTQKSISSHAATAKAIRTELKSIFPTVKFSVTSESFSMGNSVHISWVDGCTVEQVEAIVGKYQYGSFNGMEDLYEITNRREDIPQTKYVQTSRRFSEQRKRETAQEMGIDFDTEYNQLHESGDYNYSRIRSQMWNTDYTNTQVQVAEKEAPAEKVETPDTKEKTFITVTFPQLNKNNTLAENFEAMVMHGTNDSKCWIQKKIELESAEFETVANSLLDNRSEMWEEIGGAWSDAPELEGYDAIKVFNSKELTDIFRKTCYTPVVEVKEKGGYRMFYVNTEGYGYARYVGVVLPQNRKD